MAESVVQPTELRVKTVSKAVPFLGFTVTCPEVGGLLIVIEMDPEAAEYGGTKDCEDN